MSAGEGCERWLIGLRVGVVVCVCAVPVFVVVCEYVLESLRMCVFLRCTRVSVCHYECVVVFIFEDLGVLVWVDCVVWLRTRI